MSCATRAASTGRPSAGGAQLADRELQFGLGRLQVDHPDEQGGAGGGDGRFRRELPGHDRAHAAFADPRGDEGVQAAGRQVATGAAAHRFSGRDE
ncbi:hypothetical protein OHA91_01455 [Streptomyces erythrochromogenes]|uniref:Uncharacterized protein n=1 Tax=Streptomyces erythrochromogenes TaxID=285574 RepID=A0ABZ1Q3M5_9ACTN|nr:hypothetical protein [Streptomyces erythrochromogenes]